VENPVVVIMARAGCPRCARVRPGQDEPQAAPGADPGWQYDLSGNLVIQIALYPDAVQLAAHNLQAHDTTYREAS
jgi:hypothetical protein